MCSMTHHKIPGSFRDPSGFLFVDNGILYRRINETYREHYTHLMSSGLYEALVKDCLIIPHDELDQSKWSTLINAEGAYKVIQPIEIPFISYPYEWSFSQLKAAALTTLELQKRALEHGMVLKDASAFNIQFYQGQPTHIDTLSFEIYKPDTPWVAYRQFCQHFLAPLALMHYCDISLNKLLRVYIDGIPLSLTSKLLPKKSYFNFSIFTDIHLHAKSQKKYADVKLNSKQKNRKMSRQSLEWFTSHLVHAITKLQWKPEKTEWRDYYSNLSYSDQAQECKATLVEGHISGIKPRAVWDLGANTGRFSQIASQQGISTVSFDIDPACIEQAYLKGIEHRHTNLLPLILDLGNPSPSLGWAHQERMSLVDRGPVDMVLALALIHHLAISNNTPLDEIAHYLSRIARNLIIEFVPKDDPMVEKLLASREDIFATYSQEGFESAFANYFDILCVDRIEGSSRSLYLLKNLSHL